jgi:hypothetical protein
MMKAYTPYRVLSRVTLRWEDQDVKSVMVVVPAGTLEWDGRVFPVR